MQAVGGYVQTYTILADWLSRGELSARSSKLAKSGENLPDCAQVVGRVGGAGQCTAGRRSSQSVRDATAACHFLYSWRKCVAQLLPLLFGDDGAFPTGFPIGIGPEVPLSFRPAIQECQAEVHMVDVRRDRRFAGTRPSSMPGRR